MGKVSEGIMGSSCLDCHEDARSAFFQCGAESKGLVAILQNFYRMLILHSHLGAIDCLEYNPMRKISIILFIVTLLSSSAFSFAHADESAFPGVWINTNEDTGACPKFEITTDAKGAASFVWWGKTHPKDSRYGPFPMSILEGEKSATAEHITKFSRMQFTVTLRGSKAVLMMATTYTDDSERDDFAHEEKFEKEEVKLWLCRFLFLDKPF